VPGRPTSKLMADMRYRAAREHILLVLAHNLRGIRQPASLTRIGSSFGSAAINLRAALADEHRSCSWLTDKVTESVTWNPLLGIQGVILPRSLPPPPVRRLFRCRP
jgi:hypothetical protein